MEGDKQCTGDFGHYLMASGLLGASVAPIILFNLELERFNSITVIVAYIPSSTKILGAITIVFTSLALCKNRNSWIYATRTSVMSNVKVIALWILGIMLCVLQQSHNYAYHNIRIFSNMDKNSTLVFVSLQTLFITWCSRFVFYETKKIKYIMSFLAVVSTVNWVDATVRSSIFLTGCNSTGSGNTTDEGTSSEDHQVIYLISFMMEFSIQATTFVITIPMMKIKGNNNIDTPLEHRQENSDGACRHVSLRQKQKIGVAVISSVLNTPFIFCIIVTPTSMNDLLNTNDIWLFCIVGAKLIVFIFITIAYYDLYKSVSIRTERVNLNFSDIALIITSSAVAACGVINFLLRIDTRKFIIYFHTWFNIIYCVYQTIFVLFLKLIVIRDKASPLLIRVKMIVIILVTYNLFYWAKDSLFFLTLIKFEIEDVLYKSLFFLLYPLVSFYRYQSAIGMIPFCTDLL